jgi:hypothetical protein
VDLALDLFKKLGLRYVLVVNAVRRLPEHVASQTTQPEPAGNLCGLITKKDLLRFMGRWARMQAAGDDADESALSPNSPDDGVLSPMHVSEYVGHIRDRSSSVSSALPSPPVQTAASRFHRSHVAFSAVPPSLEANALNRQGRATASGSRTVLHPDDADDDAFVDVHGKRHPFSPPVRR